MNKEGKEDETERRETEVVLLISFVVVFIMSFLLPLDPTCLCLRIAQVKNTNDTAWYEAINK